MSCPDCLVVRCRFHPRGWPHEKARAVYLSSARRWARKWDLAEKRLRAAKKARLKAFAAIRAAWLHQIPVAAPTRSQKGRDLANTLSLAEYELRLAFQERERVRNTFATLMKDLLEEPLAARPPDGVK